MPLSSSSLRVLWLALIFLSASVVIAQTQTDPSQNSYTCSGSSPCKIGCCSKSGYCGFGPTFCGSGNCTSGCSAKSECDPGYGSQWATSEKCPLNVCCSQYGFCGTTQDFCGNAKVQSPSCSSSGGSAANRIIGYYEGWSPARVCDGLYPEDLPYQDYTHLNYAFAYVDPSSFAVAPMSSTDPDLMSRLVGLKQLNPGLKVWISIGGWSMNDADQPTAKAFSNLAASSSAQSAFFKSLLSMLSTYGFDGVDIDWEYPVAPERSGIPADFKNYVSFLKNLKNALGSSGHTYGLSITLPSSYWYMQNFDIVNIAPIVDWFNIMTYDLHGTWDSSDPYIGPYIYAHTNLTEIDQAMQLLWRNNIDPAKVTMGLGFYGRSFTLSNPSCTTAGCGFSAGGNPGPCTQSAGTLSFAEIEDVIANQNPTVTLDQAAAVKQVVWGGNQWVSYDDVDTLKLKVQYANSRCLGGLMVWASSTDDSLGTAASALNNATGRINLSQAARSGVTSSGLTQCVWGGCGKGGATCPYGTSPAQRSDGGGGRGNAGIYTGCPSGQQRNYCCPSNNVPTCQWRGTASICNDAGCKSGEIQVASDKCGTGKCCDFNHKNLCCIATSTDTAMGQCSWQGSAPICSVLSNFGQASCPKGTSALTEDKEGAGGEQSCGLYAGYKSYCCPSPAPFSNCGWYDGQGTNYSYWPPLASSWDTEVIAAHQCGNTCPSGQTPVAADNTQCTKGTTAYFCCDDPTASTSPVSTADPNICEVPSGIIPESFEPEPDDPSDTLTELEYYDTEEDCFVSGEPNSGDGGWQHDETKRWLADYMPQYHYDKTLLKRSSGNDTSYLHELHEHYSLYFQIIKRGNSRSSAVCKNKPGRSRNNVKASIRSSPYRTAIWLLQNTNQQIWYAAVKNCGKRSLTAIAALPGGLKRVVEHVWEIQGVKGFFQAMLDGVKPGGGTLSTGQLPWTPFDTTSMKTATMFNTWTSMGFNGITVGTTPIDSFMSYLGTASDYTNNLVAEAKLNGMKNLVWQGVDLVAASTWKNSNHAVRLGLFETARACFDYMNTSPAQAAFKYVYTNHMSLANSLGSAMSSNAGVNYPVQAAYKEWSQAQFQNMGANALRWMNLYLNDEISWWSSSAARSQYGAATAVTNLATLNNYKATMQTWASVGTNWLT